MLSSPLAEIGPAERVWGGDIGIMVCVSLGRETKILSLG